MQLYTISADCGGDYLETVVDVDMRGIRRGQIPDTLRDFAESWARGVMFTRGGDTIRIQTGPFSPRVISSREDTQRIAHHGWTHEWEISNAPF
jgi:hypothetical protein